jgi:hypothetical protein
LPVKFSAV